MQKTCAQCSANFEIPKEDIAFYEKVSPVFNGQRYDIPAPTLCPACRAQRRFHFRNFFNLYHRTCDLTGKKILSMYDKDAPFPVYEMHEWWSDKWDELSYAQEPNFEKSVFEQLKELHRKVPRMSVMNTLCENTDYCNLSRNSRNCYLVFGNIGNEDCYYGHIVWQSKQCIDCLYVYRSERCYECVDCIQCYNLAFAQDCDNCSDSRFLLNCTGCKHCFGCVGLRNKEYHLFNQPLSKDEYESRMKEFNAGSYEMTAQALQKLHELSKSNTVKNYHGHDCENVSGDYLYNCRNVHDSYDLKNCEDCRYCATLESFVDAYDCNYSPTRTELSLENVFVVGYHILFCHNVMNDSSDMLYCDHCFGCKNCFGCTGLKNKQYCIFNKQYSQQEYEKTVPRLIEVMQRLGEWGEYFPVNLSPFAYNETMAQEYFPKTPEELGDAWKDIDQGEQQYLGPPQELPDDIQDAEDDICKKILNCEASGKPYKIIPQELALCKELQVPLPRSRFVERHKARMAQRNPRILWDRKCAQCSKAIQTTYAPERPEVVYCEECYLQAVS